MSVETFAERLLDARKAAGYGDSPTAAVNAMKKAEEAGWGVAPSYRQAVHEHEKGAMPGGDVVLCYAATYSVNPIWLVTGIGPREWDAGSYRKGSAERFAAEVRNVARWMLRVAKDDSPIMAMLSEGEAPVTGDPTKKKKKGRGTRKPQHGTG